VPEVPTLNFNVASIHRRIVVAAIPDPFNHVFFAGPEEPFAIIGLDYKVSFERLLFATLQPHNRSGSRMQSAVYTVTTRGGSVA
jgi:hypothetical protein